jgi:hypothetical protein
VQALLQQRANILAPGAGQRSSGALDRGAEQQRPRSDQRSHDAASGESGRDLENTDAINKMTGQGNIQDFSSSAWLQFRQAIFDGLGNLLPKYAMAVPTAAIGAKVMQSGLIKVHSGEEIVPADVVRRGWSGGSGMGASTINTAVNVTNPTEVADPVYLGNAIGWRLANNPNLRP